MEQDNMASQPGRRDLNILGWYSLAVLVIVFMYAVIDRAVFGILAEQIKNDLGLSDTQLGLLQGVGLTLIAAVSSYPTGWMADRFDRRLVLVFCVTVWSISVVGCGVSPNFIILLLMSGMVGIGETGFTTVNYAVMPELFRGAMLPVGNSVAAISKIVSGAVGLFVTSLIIGAVEKGRGALPFGLADWPVWRLTFLATVLGLPVALALIATLPRRVGLVRHRAVAKEATVAGPSDRGLVEHLRLHSRAIIGFMVGYMIMVIGTSGLGVWSSVIMIRYFGFTAVEVGNVAGVLSLIAAGGGFLIGLVAYRLTYQRFGRHAPIILVCGCYVILLVTTVPMAFARTGWEFFYLLAVQSLFGAIPAMYMPGFVQESSPPHLRARVFSIWGFTILASSALGAPITGWLSDAFPNIERPLLTLSVATVPVSIILGLAVIIWSYGGYEAAVADSRSIAEDGGAEPAAA